MPAEPDVVCLAGARRARKLRDQRKGLALVVQAEPDAVRVIVGNEDEGAELAVDPDLGEVIALEILEACKAAREASRRG